MLKKIFWGGYALFQITGAVLFFETARNPELSSEVVQAATYLGVFGLVAASCAVMEGYLPGRIIVRVKLPRWCAR